MYFATDQIGKVLSGHAPRRCGSNNLAKELSNMLRGMIDLQLPSMKSKLELLISKTEEDCHKIGKSMDRGATRENLIKISQELDRSVSSHVYATGVDRKVWQAIEEIFQEAAYQISQTAPLFAINRRLISYELLVAYSSTITENPIISLQFVKDHASEGVESKVIAIGGAKWALVYKPQRKHVGMVKGSIYLKCVHLPRGASSVRAKYTVSSDKARHPCSDEYTFSLKNDSADTLQTDFGYVATGSIINVEAKVNVMVSPKLYFIEKSRLCRKNTCSLTDFFCRCAFQTCFVPQC